MSTDAHVGWDRVTELEAMSTDAHKGWNRVTELEAPYQAMQT